MKRWNAIFMVVSLCICTAVWSQESKHVEAQNTAPTVTPGDKYITEWLVLGPFSPNDLDMDFLAHVGGEAKVQPKPGDTIITQDGTTLTWKHYKSKADIINFHDAVGYNDNATAYAFCILQSGGAEGARIYLGSDDGISVWINGRRVHRHEIPRGIHLDQDMCRADLKSGENRCLVKVSQGAEAWGFAMRVDASPPNHAVLSGVIADEAGQPVPEVDVRLKQDEKNVAWTQTDDSGSYRMGIFPASGQYDLYAGKDRYGDLRTGIRLVEGQSQKLNLTLKEAVNIEGTLLMLDNETPHMAVVVQAVMTSGGKPVGRPISALSDENGKYQITNLRPGPYRVRCYALDGYIYYKSGADGTVEIADATSLQVQRGRIIKSIDFRFAPFKKGTWKNYSYPHGGLADNTVRVIHRAPDGIMWFGTESGASRHDGKEFVHLTANDGLMDNWIGDIYHDPDGIMWFGTLGGVSQYDGRKFTNLTMRDGLMVSFVKNIYRDPNGAMWFGGLMGGISRYDGKEFVNWDEQDGLGSSSVKDIYCDPDGVMWFGTLNGVSRLDGDGLFFNSTEKYKLANTRVNAIYQDPDGIMWFGTFGRGIFRYDGNEFVNITEKDGLAGNSVRRNIYRNPDGVTWFGTDGGVSRYDGEGFVNFTTKDGLVDDSIIALYGDPDGVIWLGTSKGVSRYDERTFVSFTMKDGLSHNSVWAIHSDPDGIMWFGTDGGVSRYDGKEFVNLTAKNGLAGNSVRSIHRDTDGVIWFGTDGGVSRYDGKKFVNFSIENGLANNSVRAIHSDTDGAIWFGTDGGVSRYDSREFINFNTEDGLANNSVWAIHSDTDGVIWFGADAWTASNGDISRYDGEKLPDFTTKGELANSQVKAVYRDPDGVMWFGLVDGGVLRYDGKETVNFTTEDGLAKNTVSAIHRDLDGVMWFGTAGGGVSGYDGTAWTSLDTRDGLAGNNVSSIQQGPDGDLWFGIDGGITRYHRSAAQPGVRIVSVQEAKRTHTNMAAISDFLVGTQITIKYSAIDFKTVPEKRQYQYRLRGIDSYWCEPTKATSFEITFRNTGTYTFAVRAIDRDLRYSKSASVSIVIYSPAFYRTGIFLLIASIAGGGVLLILIFLAVRHWRSSRVEPTP